MPRYRTIKPSFWEDEDVARLSPLARLLFIATWNLADDEGRLRWTVDYIKAGVFMYDNLSNRKVADLMREVTDAGFVIPYTARGRSLAFVRKFTHHQKINRPQDSQLPPPPLDPMTDSLIDSVNDSVNSSVNDSVNHSPPEEKGKEGSSSAKAKPKAKVKFGDQARVLASAEWERREAKPICGFPALCERVQEALDAGHPPERVAVALPRMSTFTRNAFDFELNGRAPRAAESETEAWLREMNQ